MDSNSPNALDARGDTVEHEKPMQPTSRGSLQSKTHEYVAEETVINRRKLERKIVRKLDFVIPPIFFLLYTCAYLDRSNIGNARLQGLQTDLSMNDALYEWSLSIFFIGYVVLEPLGNLVLKKIGPRYWITICVLVFGVGSTLQVVAFNFAGLAVARLFVGAAEGALTAAFPFYYSLFYKKDEIALRTAIFISGSAIAGAFGGLIAFGVQHITSSIARWKILFLIEGLATVLTAVLSFLLLPNSPATARFLKHEERAFAQERIDEEYGDKSIKLNLRHAWQAVIDYKMWLQAIIWMGINTSLSSISVFLPTIILELGYTSAQAQLHTVPVYMVAFVAMLIVSFTSDRSRDRGWHLTILPCLSAIGYIIFAVVDNNASVRYGMCFLMILGLYPMIPLGLVWPANNFGSSSKRAVGIALPSAIGQCFSLLGTHLYPSSESPSFIKGNSICAAFLFVASIAAFVKHTILAHENRKRDRIEGSGGGNRDATVEEFADKAYGFRYVT